MRHFKHVIFLLIVAIFMYSGLAYLNIIPAFWNLSILNDKNSLYGTENLTEKSQAAASNSQYPDWLKQMVSLNSETIEYAEEYKNREDYIGKPIDLSKDYTKGEVPFLLQWDEKWGYDFYGNDAIGAAGCGPTCLSMAYIYLKGDISGNPRKMAEFTYTNGFYTKEGTSWDLWTDGIEKLGLIGEELTFDESVMENALDSNSLIICSMRPGDFTSTGHYILIRGYNSNGFYVNDPNHISNSKKQWTFDKLDGQIKCLWSISLLH